MTYEMRIFCATGGAGATDILDRVLARAEQQNAPLRTRDRESSGTAWASATITTAAQKGAEILPLEIHAASGAQTASTIRALSADRPGIDAYALMPLGSLEVDWAAASAVWQAFYSLWPVLPHDDGSGFDVDMNDLVTTESRLSQHPLKQQHPYNFRGM